MNRFRIRPVIVAVAAVLLAGCGSGPSPAGSSAPPAAPSTALPPAAPSSALPPAAAGGPSEVMVVAEENETYLSVVGSGLAPYLDSVAAGYGTATAMDAGYPTHCPSLAAYLLMTSGDRFGVCDDDTPAAHPIRADNVFRQVAASGRQWRNYAESMPAPCTRGNAGTFLVRHAPAAYYTSEDARCPQWMVPLGGPTAGALHEDVSSGDLPAYSFVTPDACHDMHGAASCSGGRGLVQAGDRWLRDWMAQVMAGPDYRAGRLIVFVTWDEGSSSDNHIPLLVISPRVRHRVVTRPITQCHLLRTVEDILRVAPLGCARSVTSLAADLGLSG